jgi:hypothetical protein
MTVLRKGIAPDDYDSFRAKLFKLQRKLMGRRANNFSDFRSSSGCVRSSTRSGGSIRATAERIAPAAIEFHARDGAIVRGWFCSGSCAVRKLIAFDDDTFDKLTQLGRGRMATLQELADEAFADLLKKHGVPFDLKDALRKSAGVAKQAAANKARTRSKDSKR